MDDSRLTPRGAGGYVAATDVATDGDAHLFINRCEESPSIPYKGGDLHQARQDLYGVVSLRHRGNANSLNDNNWGDSPHGVTMQHATTTKVFRRLACAVACALIVAIGAAGAAFAADAASFEPYAGIRFYKTVGVAKYEDAILDAADVQAAYNTYMKSTYHDTDDSVDFVVQTPLHWENVLVNESTTPTLAQMRDPNWSGYVWNRPSHPNYANAAEIDSMLQASCVKNGKCKISINPRLSATSGANAPQFMVSNGWAWGGDGPSRNNIRVKYYNNTARQYVKNFMHAALHRFDNPNISSVKIDEYFPGTIKPGDWSSSGGQDAYEDGYLTFMRGVLADAPRDASGDRVAIYQTNPMTNADAFTSAQIKDMMLGIADSNAQMFEEPPGQVTLRSGVRGFVPMSAPLDAPPFNHDYRTNYDGTANPFGYTDGNNSVLMAMPQIAWYYGRLGPDSMDQEFIAKPGIPTNNFQAAMDLLGSGGKWYGTGSGKWGGVPYDS